MVLYNKMRLDGECCGMYIGHKGENQIEFVVEGYQKWKQAKNYFEANWLNVTISVLTPTLSWKATAPAILAEELIHFVDWLQALKEQLAQNRYFDFEDPSLYVCMVAQDAHTITLEFHLHLDFRRPQERNHETRVAVTLTFAELDTWVRALKQDAERFPVRYVFDML